MSIRLVVACGSGIVTSTILEQKLKEVIKEEKLDVTIQKVSINGLLSALPDADLVVTTSRYTGETLGKAILSGTPVITGIGEEEFIKKFIDTVKSMEAK